MLNKRSGVIILCGGNSSRMGFPKAFLPYRGKTFLECIIDEYSLISDEIIAVINAGAALDEGSSCIERIAHRCRVVLNHNPEYGKFYSLRIGVEKLISEFAFMQYADNPLVNVNVLDKLLLWRNAEGISVPASGLIGGHPVLLSPPVLGKIRSAGNYDLHFKEFFSGFRKTYVEVADESVLVNINTPSDYRKHIASFPL